MLSQIAELKKQGKKIGLASGVYDLMHSGHAVALQSARQQCDLLVIGILDDPTVNRPISKSKPILSMFERWLLVQAVVPDAIIIPFSSEEDLENMILIIRPHIRFCGSDYINKNHTGKELCKYLNVNIVYQDRSHGYSTSNVISRILAEHKRRLIQ